MDDYHPQESNDSDISRVFFSRKIGPEIGMPLERCYTNHS